MFDVMFRYSASVYELVFSDPDKTSALANVVMAFGVVFAAYNIRIQKRIHFVDLHNRFQQEIRKIQEKLPSDINTRTLRLNPEQQRIVRMYWYAVFDEWLTCKKTNRGRELHQVWERFAWGAKSAIDHLPIFAGEFVDFRNSKPYLLGTHDEFFAEVERFCRSKNTRGGASNNVVTRMKNSIHRAWSKRQDRKCIFLFGIPCSGKTSVAKKLENDGWEMIGVDEIIIKFDATPSKKSFIEWADEICFEIYRKAQKIARNKDVVVELGCLLPKENSDRLAAMLRLAAFDVSACELKVAIDTAIQRAKIRNARLNVASNKGELPIDSPDDLGDFLRYLDDNKPRDCKVIDVLDMPVDRIVDVLRDGN